MQFNTFELLKIVLNKALLFSSCEDKDGVLQNRSDTEESRCQVRLNSSQHFAELSVF